MTKHPTFFGIETPKGEFLYLRYAPGNIDTLGERYLQNPLELELSRLQGFAARDDKATPRKVFSAPGKYVLRFQDANTMAGIGLHKLSCEVWIAPRDATTVRSRHPASAVATEGALHDSQAALKPGCDYYPNCGGGMSCCTTGPDPTFCTCSHCCVGQPPGNTLATGACDSGATTHRENRFSLL